MKLGISRNQIIKQNDIRLECIEKERKWAEEVSNFGEKMKKKIQKKEQVT